MLLDIVVCEDNKEYRKMITDALYVLIQENKINASVVLECASPQKVKDYLQTAMPNVFFLDIDLNTEMNGLDLAAYVHQKNSDAYIVFISQYTNLVFKSFKVRPFDFLPKPITSKELKTVLLEIHEDYMKKFDMKKPGFLYVKTGSHIYHIPKGEITFLEKYGNKCSIHALDKTVYCYQALDALYEKLDDAHFVRCHKSFIVNKKFAEHIDLKNMEILLTTGEKCFIGGKYKKGLMAIMDEAPSPEQY